MLILNMKKVDSRIDAILDKYPFADSRKIVGFMVHGWNDRISDALNLERFKRFK